MYKLKLKRRYMTNVSKTPSEHLRETLRTTNGVYFKLVALFFQNVLSPPPTHTHRITTIFNDYKPRLVRENYLLQVSVSHINKRSGEISNQNTSHAHKEPNYPRNPYVDCGVILILHLRYHDLLFIFILSIPLCFQSI
jgi:hypothetical protein